MDGPALAERAGVGAAPSWQHPLPRRTYLWTALGAGLLTGAATFYLVGWWVSDSMAVPLWPAVVAVQAVALAWWTGNLRPLPVVGGVLMALWGLVVGFFAAMALFHLFWAGPAV